MKNIFILYTLFFVLCTLSGCCRCESEPIVEQNQRLIVPPNFGKMPK